MNGLYNWAVLLHITASEWQCVHLLCGKIIQMNIWTQSRHSTGFRIPQIHTFIFQCPQNAVLLFILDNQNRDQFFLRVPQNGS